MFMLDPAYEVLRDNVDRASRELGIDKPVKVSRPRIWNSNGGYTSETDTAHRVTVHRGLSAWRANRVLWHELEHVAHAQKLGGWAAFDRRVAEEIQEVRDHHGITGELPFRLYNGLDSERRALRAERRRHGYRLVRRVPLYKRVRWVSPASAR